jgi:hypothetical protein
MRKTAVSTKLKVPSESREKGKEVQRARSFPPQEQLFVWRGQTRGGEHFAFFTFHFSFCIRPLTKAPRNDILVFPLSGLA